MLGIHFSELLQDIIHDYLVATCSVGSVFQNFYQFQNKNKYCVASYSIRSSLWYLKSQDNLNTNVQTLTYYA